MPLDRRSFLLATLGLPWPLPALAAAPPFLAIQPFADAAPLAAVVAPVLTAFYAVEVRALEPLPLPARAFYPTRKRYRAERLLDHLERTAPPEAERVLGLLTVDISTTKPPHADWGILGLATIDGRCSVLSSFRCRRRARNRAHALERLAKTAVHEIGHTFGLEHCPNQGCLMQDAGGSVLTTDGERDLCADCRAVLRRTGRLRPGAVTVW